MEKKKKGWKKIIKYVLIILLFTFSFWYLFKDISFNDIATCLKDFNGLFLTLALLMVVAQIFLQGLCFIVMGKGLGVKLNPFSAFGYCGVDLFFSQLTPFAVGGQPVMIYQMKSKGNHPVAKTTTMALLYSFLNKVALIIMAIFAAIFCYNDFFASDTNDTLMIFLLIFGVLSNLLIASLSIVFMVLGEPTYRVGAKWIFWAAKHKMTRHPFNYCKKLRVTIDNFQESNIYIKNHLLVSVLVLLICIIKRFATFAIAYFIYKGFGLNEHGFMYIIFAQTVYAVVSDSFPIPGGIGSAETSIKTLYEGIYPPGDIADVAALLVRIISYYVLILVSGITTFVVMAINPKKKKEVLAHDEDKAVLSKSDETL